jgi:hypothetical protein
MMVESGHLHDAVGRMSRFDRAVDGKILPGDGAVPDFMVALALPDQATIMLSRMTFTAGV